MEIVELNANGSVFAPVMPRQVLAMYEHKTGDPIKDNKKFAAHPSLVRSMEESATVVRIKEPTFRVKLKQGEELPRGTHQLLTLPLEQNADIPPTELWLKDEKDCVIGKVTNLAQ